MNNKKILVLLLVLTLTLSSCVNISKNIDKIKSAQKNNREEQSTASVSEYTTISSSEDVTDNSTPEESISKKEKPTKSKKKTTTKKEESRPIVNDLFISFDDITKDVFIPEINEDILDFKDVKDFNEEMKKLKEDILNKAEMSIFDYPIKSEYSYFDTDNLLSIRLRYYLAQDEELNDWKLVTRTITIDKKKKRALSNAELLKTMDVEKIALINTYINFLKGYLYHDENMVDNYETIENLSFEQARSLENNFNDFPLYYEDDIFAYLPLIKADGSSNSDIEIIFSRESLDFIKENKHGAFSKIDLENDEDIDAEILDLSSSDVTNTMLLHFYMNGKLQVQDVKRDFNSSKILIQKAENEVKVKKGQELVLKLDSKVYDNSNHSQSFYRLVFESTGGESYVMDMNYQNPAYEGLSFEYLLEPRENYKKKLEESETRLKSAVNLLGVPLERINELYGYGYKLEPKDDKYQMKYENEEFPMLVFKNDFKNSTVESVFSDFDGYNMIADINVGMTAIEIEKMLGYYSKKVTGTNGLYDSYTVFNIDRYELYVYGKDSDLISLGMLLKYPEK